MSYFLYACTQNGEKAHSRGYAQLILTTLRAVVLIRRTHVVTFWCAFGALCYVSRSCADSLQHTARKITAVFGTQSEPIALIEGRRRRMNNNATSAVRLLAAWHREVLQEANTCIYIGIHSSLSRADVKPASKSRPTPTARNVRRFPNS